MVLIVFLFVSSCVCFLQSIMAAVGDSGPGATQCVTKVALSISCQNLLDMDTFSKSDPLCVLFMNSSGPHWCEVSGVNRLVVYKHTHIQLNSSAQYCSVNPKLSAGAGTCSSLLLTELEIWIYINIMQWNTVTRVQWYSHFVHSPKCKLKYQVSLLM